MKRRSILIVAALAALAVLLALATARGPAVYGSPLSQTRQSSVVNRQSQIPHRQVPPLSQDVAPETETGVAVDELAKGGPYPGVYAARDWRVIDPSVYPAVGGHETFTWAEIEGPTEGAFYWGRLDAFIANQAALGKKAAIGITTYNGRIEGGLVVPAWFQTNHPGSLISCSGGSGVQIPRYWDNTYRTKYGNFVQALANHLGTNANIAYVQIGVGLYGETQPSDDDRPIQDTYDTTCVKNAMAADGRTDYSAFWVQTAKQIIDRWATAFAGRQKLFLVYTPRFVDPCEKQQLTSYAAGTYGIGLFAGGFYADTMTVFSTTPGGDGCQKWDPILYWNSSPTATIPIALESYRYMLPTYEQFYWGMLGALNKHPDYLSLESDLFFTGNVGSPIWENLNIMTFANRYLGKTAATAPNAWVALRDTSPATNGIGCTRWYFYPQNGDFDYYLYRDDTAAGGRTTLASSIANYTYQDVTCGPIGTVVANAQYDSKLAGKGAQGWMTRRTDTASGNNYMYFRVDDAFVSGQGLSAGAVITVAYFDTGSDTWQIQWRNAAGDDQALSVTKANSNIWKTVTFPISNISFAAKYENGNDFRIYNGGSGDEYIHMAMIGKPVVAGPTATPTRTATRTLTPTPGPVTVTFQKGVSPSAGYSGVADSFISQFGEADPVTNYGISPTLSLRNTDYKAGLLRFDVSEIPQAVNVLSATLSVHVYNSTNANPLDVRAFRMLRSWTETGVTWNQAAAGTPWASAGANGIGTDRDDLVLDSLTMSGVGVWYEFDITDLARLWVTTPGQNFGVALKTSTGGQVEYELWSSDYDFAPIVRPKLTIVYTSQTGPTPTRTPTRTATISPTPTRTQTPAPQTVVFQRGVGPIPGFAGVYDTFISNFGDTTANYGISPTLELRSNDVRAALLRFDISSLPPAANIVSAEMSVHVDYKTNDFTMPVSLYRMVRPWNEMEATWLRATTSTLWGLPGANAGADRITTAAASVVMASANEWYEFDVTNLVKLWLTNPAENKGVILKAGTGNSVAYVLRSSEYFSAPAYRPKLTIRCYNCQPQGGYRIMLPVIISNFTVVP